MKKQIALVIGLAAVVIGGVFAIVVLGSPARDQADTVATASPVAPSGGSPATAAAGTYVDYKTGIVESAAGTKVLFFYAPWCPQCRALEKSIKESKIPDGVTIVKVDYDSNQALRQKYGVTIQTSLVKVDDSGALVKKYVAYDTPNLAAVTKNLDL